MGKYGHVVDAGRINTVKEIRKQAQQQQERDKARGLQSSSIGADGLRIIDDGNLTIEDGGDIILNGGGRITVNDGGQIIARHPNGIASIWAGSFVDDGQPGYGLLVQYPDAHDIFSATSRTTGGKVTIGGIAGTNTPVEIFSAYGELVRLYAYSSGMTLGSWDNTTGIQMLTNDGPINLAPGTDQVTIAHTTTGSAANCVIDATTGLIQRSTSSLRYKRDIQDLDVDADAVLALRPRTWRDKSDVAADPDTTRRHVGFIAEELDELGLTEFVVYDGDGPEAIQYDRLTAALIPVVQRQQSQIDALTARLDALEAP